MSDTTSIRHASALLMEAAVGGDPAAAAWLGEAMAHPPEPGTPAFMRLFAAAGRRLRGQQSALSAATAAQLVELGIANPQGWSAERLARGAILLAAIEAADRAAPDKLAAAMRTSDTGERVAILQALPLLPDGGRFAALAAEACRSSVQPVFEAVACDNAYPAAHFSDPVFNQMVLKAVFTGAPLLRVVGLAARLGPALRRMATDFRDERRAAARPVPADLDLLIEPGRLT